MSRTVAQPQRWTWFLLPWRRKTTWRHVLPLGVFLLVFGVLVAVLEWGRWLRFSDWEMFLLLALSPWVWWWHHQGHHGLGRFRGGGALVLRWLLFGLMIMALAGPRALRENDQLSVMYALDLSDSITAPVRDEALRFVLETVGSKSEGDEAGLVLFGREAAVELPPRQSFPFEAINSQFARDGTNLENGLALAAAVIPEENPGRIILISDGTATEGDLNAVVTQLRARRIAVDVLPVGTSIEKEVWLERIDLPPAVKVGESYEAHVILTAIHEGEGTLVVQENGREIYREALGFETGKQRVTLPFYLREPGYYEYTARLLMADGEDHWVGNNVAVNDLFLRGEGKALVVTDPEGDARDWQALVQALEASGRKVEVRDSFAFPRNAVSLMPFNCVIFVNAPADVFDAAQLAAVKRAVYHQGLGYLMVGGQNSFGPGGYHRTAIEETLPVSMDIKQKKILPKGALVMILHTCEFAEGNTWGKRIARRAVQVLGSEDEVGVIDYEGGREQWLFPLMPVENYDHLIMKINQAQPGDMPSFAPTMELALAGLQASDAAMKHMIIISDGDPTPPVPGLLQAFVDGRISVSTVGINPHTPNDTAILQSIAEATGGRFYEPFDSAQLPSIFIKEAKTLKRSMIQNKTFTPEVAFPSPILKGVESMPPLQGYVLTSAKPRSQTILRGPETEEINPVLSLWGYGTGAAAAFTSDLSPNWGAEWVSWERYQAFVSQMITEISRAEEESALQLQVVAAGSRGTLTVEDQHEAGGFLELQARIVGPDDGEETLTLDQVAPRRYRASFPLWGTGRYQVMVGGSGPGRSERALASLPVAYSPEYLQLHSHPKLLESLAERTSGRVLNGRETALYDFERVSKETSRSVVDWFLVALAVLVPLDVGWRRVHLDAGLWKRWAWRRRKWEVSRETLSALLHRKSEVGARLGSDRRGVPSPGVGRTPAAPPSSAETTKVGAESIREESSLASDSDAGERGWSTTERLLAQKRQRQQRQQQRQQQPPQRETQQAEEKQAPERENPRDE